MLLLTTMACGWFDDPSPDEARLVLTGDAGENVAVVTSTRFVSAVDEVGVTRVQLFDADSTLRMLPFDTVYTIRGDQRFFVQLSRADTVSDPAFRMQVLLDGDVEYDESAQASQGPFAFVYTFNQPTTGTVEVF